jgi:hypothetical protein
MGGLNESSARDTAARLVRLGEALDLAAALVREILRDVESHTEPPARRGQGRPRVVPTAAQVDEVLRLRTTNGRLGMRAIGDRVGISWRQVARILEEAELASQNPVSPSQKPIEAGDASRSSDR